MGMKITEAKKEATPATKKFDVVEADSGVLVLVTHYPTEGSTFSGVCLDSKGSLTKSAAEYYEGWAKFSFKLSNKTVTFKN